MESKNILQMVEHLLAGGAERMAVNISNVLANQGHHVVLCPTRGLGPLEVEVQKNVMLSCIYKKSFFDVFAFFKLYTIVRKNKIQIIHAHSTTLFWAYLIKIFFPSVKIIWHDHYGNRETDSKNFIYKKIAYAISGIITVNENLKEWSLKNMKIKDKNNIVYLNNFPVLNHIEEYKKLYKSKEGINIIILANLRIEKDHLTLVKALSLIKDQLEIHKVKVLFAGLYWRNDYFNQIMEVIENNDLDEHIEFLGSVSNVSELLGKSDIGILCSTFEGLPVSLLEYGLAELPVIVTDVGQCANVVDYGNAGIIVKPQQAQELANSIVLLLEEANYRTKLGRNLKTRVLLNYGYVNFLNVYNSILKSI
jgi:glycosyltransferase involved in cell wall biosynthesis